LNSLKAFKNEARKILRKPFPLLDDNPSKWFLIIFCGLFATFFILFYQPFNIQEFKYDSTLGQFLSIWSVGIVGAAILGFSQFFLKSKTKLDTFNLGQFLLWTIFEFTLIWVIIFLIFRDSTAPLIDETLLTLKHTLSIAFLPYFLACLLIAVKKLSNRTKQVEKNPIINTEQHLFKDENGKVMLTLKPMQILFLKSENNYTSIFYLQNEKVERMLIRTNLKKLEGELTYPNLMRIHRSYMVNLKNISSVQRKKGSFELLLNQLPEMPIKVSEKYKTSFESKIEI